LALAWALSLGVAVSLGITRIAYGLLLPPMQTDLGWSYLLAGATNTANAVGDLAGALSVPALKRRWGAAVVLQAGMALARLLKKNRANIPRRGPNAIEREYPWTALENT